MPMLHTFGKHGTLQSIQDSLQDDEFLFASLDDLHVVCCPECVVPIYKFVEQALEESFRVCVALSLLLCQPTHEPHVPSEAPLEFVPAHDDATWSSLTALLGWPFATQRQGLASFPFASGGCGLRSAMRSRVPARWASWANSLRIDPAHAPCCGKHHDQVFFRLLKHPPLQCSSCMPRRSPCTECTMLPSGGHSQQPSPGRVSTNVFLRYLVSRHSDGAQLVVDRYHSRLTPTRRRWAAPTLRG